MTRLLDKAMKAFARVRARRNGEVTRRRTGPSISAPTPPQETPAAPAFQTVPAAPAADVQNVVDVQSPQPPSPYRLVRDAAGLEAVLAALMEPDPVGVDVETSGLNPRTDSVRLLSVAVPVGDGDSYVYLIDCAAVDPRPLFPALADKPLLFHNGLFDLQFLMRMGLEPGRVGDTLLQAVLLDGPRKPRGYYTLAACVQRELNEELPKALQKSDWSGELSPEQLAYAARDAEVVLRLSRALGAKLTAAGLTRAAELEMRALPAVAWLSLSGVAFDAPAWASLAAEAGREAADLERRLNESAPHRPDRLPGMAGWNWASAADVTEALGLLGMAVEKTDDDTLAALGHPFAELVRRHRSASKLVSTYGVDWCRRGLHGDRLFADWRQVGCITGRMASGNPNLQNLPGDRRYRECFRAPAGRVLIKADYSQIELRIAAQMSGDAVMRDAYARGLDLHTLTARSLVGREDVTPADRKLAKPVNFGLVYGLGVTSLRKKAKSGYGLELSEADARRYRDTFFKTYGGIEAWHRKLKRDRSGVTRTATGRRATIDPDSSPGMKANYMVQGTGGDGIKAAMGLLWERRGEMPGAFPVLAVHDEVVIECDADQADAVSAWLRQAMIDGMAPLVAPVPVAVDVTVGPTWAGE